MITGQVESELRAGDVVVVSPEYSLLWGEGVDETIITHLEHDPAGLRHLDLATSRRLCDAGLVWIARKLRCDIGDLAKANRLKKPSYAIKPGQTLKLDGCG